jgi:uncharacterized protein YkwD
MGRTRVNIATTMIAFAVCFIAMLCAAVPAFASDELVQEVQTQESSATDEEVQASEEPQIGEALSADSAASASTGSDANGSLESAYASTALEASNTYESDATLNIEGVALYSEAYKVLDSVNQQRAANGLSALTMDKDLLNAAMQRAAETVVRWSHTRPNGQSCFTVSSKAFGENIAIGQGSAASVMDSWMNSEGHKANILGSSYTTIGVGAVKQNGVIRWVQIFGSGKASNVSKTSDATKTFNVDLLSSKWLPTFSMTKSGSKYSLVITNSGCWVNTCVSDSCINWVSADPSIATVDPGGNVAVVGSGTTTVSAKVDKNTGHYTVNVKVGYETVYRMYNPKTSEHLFTTDRSEYKSLTAYDWEQEGVAWNAPERGSVGVYRLYNPGLGALTKMSHHYTTDRAEAENLVRNHGWVYDFGGQPAFYSAEDSSGALDGASAVYRLYNSGLSAHHYTLDSSENSSLIKEHGWKGEGTGFYAYSVS